MIFDCIVGNPPYSKNLHLQIIDKAIRHLSEEGAACFIHPARWYLDPLYKYKKNCDRLKFKYIVDRLDYVKFIDMKSANRLFNIYLHSDMMISMLKKDITGKMIEHFNKMCLEVLDIVLPYTEKNNVLEHIEADKVEGFRCEVKEIVPMYPMHKRLSGYARTSCVMVVPYKAVFYNGKDEVGKDWTTVRSRNKYTKDEGTALPHSIEFNTKEEALNFQKSCQTNFYKKWIQIVKVDMHTPLKFLPWMNDYSHPWTDNDYCEFFGKLGMSKECQEWMCRDVYDYRVKDFIDYINIVIKSISPS